jgi:hypothetical protein
LFKDVCDSPECLSKCPALGLTVGCQSEQFDAVMIEEAGLAMLSPNAKVRVCLEGKPDVSLGTIAFSRERNLWR